MQILWILPFYLFLSQFLPNLDENYIKIQRTFRTTGLPSWFGLILVLGPQSFLVFLKKIRRTRTGPSPVQFSVQNWSIKQDLEALLESIFHQHFPNIPFHHSSVKENHAHWKKTPQLVYDTVLRAKYTDGRKRSVFQMKT